MKPTNPKRSVTFLRAHTHVSPASTLTLEGAAVPFSEIPERVTEYRRGQVLEFGSVNAARAFARAFGPAVCAVGVLYPCPVVPGFEGKGWRINATGDEFQENIKRVVCEAGQSSRELPTGPMMREAGRRTFILEAMGRGHTPLNQGWSFECTCGASAHIAPDLTLTGDLVTGDCRG